MRTVGASAGTLLEGGAKSDLCGEGNAYGRAGAKEVAEGAGRNTELVATRDWAHLCASGIKAKGSDVGEIVYGNRQSGDIRNVVVAGIVSIEEVEEFDEGRGGPALAEADRPTDAEIGLQVGGAAELI